MFDLSSTMVGSILKDLGLIRSISEAKKGKKRGSRLPVDQIINLYVSGNSSVSIAKLLNISKMSVLNVLKDSGVDRDNKYEKWHEKINEIADLYLSGYSMNYICESLSIPYSTLHHNLHKLGIVRSDDKNHIRMPYDEWLTLQPAYKQYRSKVLSVTNRQPLNTLENSDKRGNSRVDGAYHLDHKFSIIEGFKQGIDPEIIGNINNLEFIPWWDNISKGFRCSITIEELFRLES
jgi:transposase-like protein